MKLIKFYKDILTLASLKADKDGYISGSIGNSDKTSPVTIKGKRLVLPTKNQLSISGWEDRIVFHPLYENVLKGESEVIEKFRNLICMRFNLSIGVLCMSLLTLAASNARHKELKPEQSEFLTKVKMIDDKSVETFQKILETLDPSKAKNNFVSIFLKRSGSVAGKTFFRVGVINFPIYTALLDESMQINGVTIRKKDKEVYKNLLEYIFKDIATNGAYNAGSDSDISPYVDALLRASIKIIAPLNDVINLFKEILPEIDDLEYLCDWVNTLDNLKSMEMEIKSIPMQAGNEGQALISSNVVADTPTQQSTAQPTTTPAVTQPVIQQTVNPNMPGFVPPWQVNQQLHNQQYQFGTPVQQPTVIVTKDGVDFGSLMASNPAIAQNAARAFNGMHQMPIPQLQQSVPRWAQPNNVFGMNQMSNFNAQPLGMGFNNYPPTMLI